MLQFACQMMLLVATADPSTEIRVESALLTLIEHAEVSASEAGLLSKINVREGETIDEGKPIAQLDEREARLVKQRTATELEVARAAASNDIKVRFAKKSSEVAEAELKRALEANAVFAKSVSQTELDRLKLIAEKSKLEIEQAQLDVEQLNQTVKIKQHELDRATLMLERRSILAPFPGMVVQWKKQRGEWVEPNTPVVRLIRVNRLRAEAFLASQTLPTNLVGRDVKLLVASSEDEPPRTFSGKLVFVSPEIDPVNGQVRIWAEIDNSKLTLQPGQNGTLVIANSK
jgi:macrolide-specific efflux system membrane fusion protein